MKAPFVPYVLIMLSCFCVYFPAYSQGTIQRSEGRFLASLDFNPASGIYNGRKNRIQNSSNLLSFPDEYRESGIKVNGMVKAAVLTMEWWTLFGEPVENYNFQWTTSGRYQVYQEGGAGYTVERNKLAKYPDLLLRFDAIKPLDVKFVIYWRFDFDTYKRIHSSFSAGFNYNVTTNVEEGLLFEPSGKNPLSVPGIRKGKGENFIDKKFNNHQHYEIYAEAKKSWLQEFNQAKNITIDQFHIISARWPVKEMLTIATLFEQYEKGVKKPSPLEIVNQELNKNQGLTAYNNNDFWKDTYEEEFSSFEIKNSLDGKSQNVVSNNKITYSVDALQYNLNVLSIDKRFILKLDKKKNIFQIINSKGLVQSVDGRIFFHEITNDSIYVYLNDYKRVRVLAKLSGIAGPESSADYQSFNLATKALNNWNDGYTRKELANKKAGRTIYVLRTYLETRDSPYGVGSFKKYVITENLKIVSSSIVYRYFEENDY